MPVPSPRRLTTTFPCRHRCSRRRRTDGACPEANFATTSVSPELCLRREDGNDFPVLVWRFAAPVRVISSAPYGGGIGRRSWTLNAQVPTNYDRTDPGAHVQ